MHKPSDFSIPDHRLLHGLAGAFSYPEKGLGEALQPLREVAVDEDFSSGPELDDRLNALFSTGDKLEVDEARLEYTRLIIGSLEMLAPPYASYYFSDQGLLGGEKASEVAAIYAEFGLRLDEAQIAFPDHLRYLLSFMSLLARRYEETRNEVFAEAYTDFRNDYVLSWFDRFAALVHDNSRHGFYPRITDIIKMSI